MIALRPAILRMARVRLPSFSASLATRVISLGSLAIFRVSSAARPPAAFSTRPTSWTRCSKPPARSTFAVSRAVRAAAGKLVCRTMRPRLSVNSAPSRPVLRAAFTSVSPARAE